MYIIQKLSSNKRSRPDVYDHGLNGRIIQKMDSARDQPHKEAIAANRAYPNPGSLKAVAGAKQVKTRG
ncbi:MAG: hypothetical protein CSA32_04015 [Desulfobulbus propionicus]|nr:MAG: hypothetical protein CSA32_04015 [Desulfobulbus propionicus]